MPETYEVQFGQHVVDHQYQPLQFELAGNVDRHRRPLEVLLVGSQEEDQDVGEDNGEERLLIEAWMRVDEEIIEA